MKVEPIYLLRYSAIPKIDVKEEMRPAQEYIITPDQLFSISSRFGLSELVPFSAYETYDPQNIALFNQKVKALGFENVSRLQRYSYLKSPNLIATLVSFHDSMGEDKRYLLRTQDLEKLVMIETDHGRDDDFQWERLSVIADISDREKSQIFEILKRILKSSTDKGIIINQTVWIYGYRCPGTLLFMQEISTHLNSLSPTSP